MGVVDINPLQDACPELKTVKFTAKGTPRQMTPGPAEIDPVILAGVWIMVVTVRWSETIAPPQEVPVPVRVNVTGPAPSDEYVQETTKLLFPGMVAPGTGGIPCAVTREAPGATAISGRNSTSGMELGFLAVITTLNHWPTETVAGLVTLMDIVPAPRISRVDEDAGPVDMEARLLESLAVVVAVNRTNPALLPKYVQVKVCDAPEASHARGAGLPPEMTAPGPSTSSARDGDTPAARAAPVLVTVWVTVIMSPLQDWGGMAETTEPSNTASRSILACPDRADTDDNSPHPASLPVAVAENEVRSADGVPAETTW